MSARTAFALLLWPWLFQGVLLVSAAFVASAKVKGRIPSPLARRIISELRPFYGLAAVVELAVYLARGDVLFAVLHLPVFVLGWLVLRSLDDDDRWKRRRRKLAEKIAQVRGQLVVVPASTR